MAEIYNGKIIEQMPLLLEKGQMPASVAYGMIERLAGVKAFRFYFYSGDALVKCPDGGLIIDLDSDILKGINGERRVVNGNVELNDAEVERVRKRGYGFSRRDLEIMLLGRGMEHERRISHPIWKVLARHPGSVKREHALDEELLKAYSSSVSGEGMGIYFEDWNKEKYILGAWCVYGLGVNSGSSADDGVGLDDDNGRLVGVAPDALTQEAMNRRFRKTS